MGVAIAEIAVETAQFDEDSWVPEACFSRVSTLKLRGGEVGS